jgi:hypothetical protein
MDEPSPGQISDGNCVVKPAGDANMLTDLSNVGGAPVEINSPLGRHVGIYSAISLNLSRLLGMGIYSTPGVILDSLGSVGMSLIFWVLGSLISFGVFNMTGQIHY